MIALRKCLGRLCGGYEICIQRILLIKLTAYAKVSGKTYESMMSEIAYDPAASADGPIVVHLKGDSSVSTI